MSDEDDLEPDLPEIPIEEPPQFDAGDPVQVGKRKRRLDIEAKESERFWQAVFGSKTGRREMYKLLRDCNAFGTNFACGPNGFPQPEATWFQAGQADWGRRMRETWLVRHTEEFAQMLRDHHPDFQKGSK